MLIGRSFIFQRSAVTLDDICRICPDLTSTGPERPFITDREFQAEV